MKSTTPIAGTLSVLAAALALTACGADDKSKDNAASASASAALPQGSESVDLKPADFTTEIDNPYWPMRPGSRWVYREGSAEGATEDVVVEVTKKTKKIATRRVRRACLWR